MFVVMAVRFSGLIECVPNFVLAIDNNAFFISTIKTCVTFSPEGCTCPGNFNGFGDGFELKLAFLLGNAGMFSAPSTESAKFAASTCLVCTCDSIA